jgi:LemA protein
MLMFIIGLVLVGAIFLFIFMHIYNGLVSLKNQVERSWANIDVILKQRYDELPQLIQILEQFVQYERGTIDRLVTARKHYGTAQEVEQKIQASQEMSIALRGVFAIGENYPDLKSNQNFMQLQTRISDLENTLADRREHYNESVTNYNTRIEQIPDVIIAGILGYKSKTMYSVSEVEKTRPDLKLKLPT